MSVGGYKGTEPFQGSMQVGENCFDLVRSGFDQSFFASVIALAGHVLTQRPHPKHLAGS